MKCLKFYWLVSASVVISMLTGCGPAGGLSGPTGTVSGKVLVSGNPLSEGSIMFFGENNGDTASATLQSDGTYSLKYGLGFSVPAGDYRVAIVDSPPADAKPIDPMELMKNIPSPKLKSKVAAKYKDPKTSQLIAVVKAGSNTDINFDLK